MLPNKKTFGFLDKLVATASLAKRELRGDMPPPAGSMSRQIGQQEGWLDDHGNFTEAGLQKFRLFNAPERARLMRAGGPEARLMVG